MITIENASYIDKQVMKELENGLQYQRSMQFTDKWAEYERFKAGDQWPQPTPATKSMPRPVFNIIDHIESHKVASVLNENVKMVFSSQEIAEPEDPNADMMVQLAMEGADKFTRYSETTWENIKQDVLNEEVLESASNIGSGIVHYFWDTERTGGLTMNYIGEIDGEVLDPSNVFFGNPQQTNLQKQPYILIAKRELLQTALDIALANDVPPEYISMLQSDKDTTKEIYDGGKKEIDGVDKVTIITKYWKDTKTRKIFFKQVCNSVVIKPDINTDFDIYPLALMGWKKRKKCIYGYGDTEGIIPNQKGINFLLAMMLLSTQNTAFPKLLVKADSLKVPITNAPGEIITDYSSERGFDGIKYMQTGTYSPQTVDLVDKFIDLTKMLSSAQDAQTGDMATGQLNASAIMLLQRAAGVPLEAIKKRFYRYLEDVGKIWEQFWKIKYNTTRIIKTNDQDGNEQMEQFLGTQYSDVPMNLKIDIGASTNYSESLAQSTLDKLFDKGVITLKQYVEYAPQNVVPFRDRLLRDIEQQQQLNQELDQQIIAMGGNPNDPNMNANPQPNQMV